MGVKVKNQLQFLLLCIMLGAATGGIIWAFLKVMGEGIYYIWEYIPEAFGIPYYTIIVCTLGGGLIGLFRRKFGDMPEELDDVMAKVKKEHRYEYKNMVLMLVAAIMPLLLGASIGPEAGMTGVIVGLCYWVGDNIKYAKRHKDEFTEIGAAVTLGVLFHSPLFGLFEVTERDYDEETVLPKNSKIINYGVCIAAGMGMYMLLGNFFGGGMGIPSLTFEDSLQAIDFVMLVPYIIVGCVLALFYDATHKLSHNLSAKVPTGLSELIGGLCLGVIGTLVPVVMFSGEEQMAELGETFGLYLPVVWLGIALLKVLITNLCIQFGLKGGHFFPLIFAGVAAGYGVAAMVVDGADRQVFAAAVVTAAMLGWSMKKPLAVTVLMLLCFPAKLLVWCFVAAAIGAKIAELVHNKDHKEEKTVSESSEVV